MCICVCVYDVIHEISATLTVFNVKFNFDYLILYFATKLTMFRLRTIGSVNSIWTHSISGGVGGSGGDGNDSNRVASCRQNSRGWSSSSSSSRINNETTLPNLYSRLQMAINEIVCCIFFEKKCFVFQNQKPYIDPHTTTSIVQSYTMAEVLAIVIRPRAHTHTN